MKVTELFNRGPWANYFLYGQPGCGKTTWGALTPDPLILLTEHHGKSSIITANPNAEVVLVHDYSHIARLMTELKQGSSDGRMFTAKVTHVEPKLVETVKFRTVVIDSISNFHEMAARHYPTDSKDDKKAGKAWQNVQRDLRAILHDLRSLPCNLVVMALATQTIGKDKVLKVLPTLFGKASSNVGQYFDGVGLVFREGDGKHSIAWSLDNKYITKAIPDPEDRMPYNVHFGKRGEGATLGTIQMALYDLPAEQVAAEWDDPDQLTWEPETKRKKSK